MRPLVLNYENDPHVYNMNDEYMVGKDILTAPVVQEDQTERAVTYQKVNGSTSGMALNIAAEYDPG